MNHYLIPAKLNGLLGLLFTIIVLLNKSGTFISITILKVKLKKITTKDLSANSNKTGNSL
jgi:hypothetical protein